MANRDKTGPRGSGPMTGRKLGFCANNENIDEDLGNRERKNAFYNGNRCRSGNGRNMGRHHGMKLGLGCKGKYANLSNEDIEDTEDLLGNEEMLKYQKEILELKLNFINEQLQKED